jgi:transcriptional regulator with XRE-family HTH domain
MRELRFARGLRQQELADQVGCERSYVSALENDVKKAPPAPFVAAMCRSLNLDDGEAQSLHLARAKSQRRYSVPANSRRQTYELVYDLFARLDRLSSLQLQGLRMILELGDVRDVQAVAPEGRIRRKDRRLQAKEVPM